MSQDRDIIINTDNVFSINVIDVSIWTSYEGNKVKLGTYKSHERAKEILNEIYKSLVSGYSGEYSMPIE